MTSIERRRAAASIRAQGAAFSIVPPPGPFRITIEHVAGETDCIRESDDTVRIVDARLLHDGREIDGARIMARRAVALDVLLHADWYGHLPIEGTAVVVDDGYQLIAYAEPSLRMAA